MENEEAKTEDNEEYKELKETINKLNEKVSKQEKAYEELSKNYNTLIANNIKKEPQVDGSAEDLFDSYCYNHFDKRRK